MTPRVALASLFVACLLCVPVLASQPEGLVGRLITNPGVTLAVVDPNGLPGVACGGFHWAEFFGSHQLDPADTLTLQMAIIPFRSGGTAVGLGALLGSSTLVQFEFRDGFVNGLPYDRFGWNDVTGQEVIFEQGFNTCSPPHVFLGGLLISQPPRRVRPGR